MRKIFLLLLALVMVWGCVAEKTQVRPQIEQAGVEDAKAKIEEIKEAYLKGKDNVEGLYRELYEMQKYSQNKKEIEKEVIKPFLGKTEIWKGGFLSRGWFFSKKAGKGYRFTRNNPGLFWIRLAFPTKDWEWKSFRNMMSISMYSELLNSPKTVVAVYMLDEESLKSLDATLREADKEKRNICFVVEKIIPLKSDSAKKIAKRKAVEGVDYKDACMVQCSAEINIGKEFDKPCWDPEVFSYLKRIYDMVRR